MENKRKILVAVTGMSPQIVTETVYALHAKQDWRPDEIHVLTTQIGYDNITKALLGENGFFGRLCQEYELPAIQFDEENIHVICDAEGKKLADIRTPEENNLAADMIVNFIRTLCADENTELHVSIAGGRKSMGFYIGYALSLFGRPQDKLSHVLVEEAFEQNREFFYPPKTKTTLNTDRYGMKDAAQAQVMLAEIPFVRMSYGMPNLYADNMSFSETVDAVQRSQKNGKLILKMADLNELKLVCGGNELLLSQQNFCVYWTMAQFAQQDKKITLPNNDIAKEEIGKGTYPDLDAFEAAYWRNYLDLNPTLSRSRSVDAEQQRISRRQALRMRITKILRETLSRTKGKMTNELGEYIAKRYSIKSEGERNNLTYFLDIPADWIEIIKE